MIRDTAATLADMLDYARDAADFVTGLNLEAFLADRKTQFATLRALEVIGEAAKRVPEEVRLAYPDIPWREIIAMRNIIAHDYLGIRMSRVFETATSFVPQLIGRLPAIISELERPTRP